MRREGDQQEESGVNVIKIDCVYVGLRMLTALSEELGWHPVPRSGGSQPFVTSGDLMSSSGLHE